MAFLRMGSRKATATGARTCDKYSLRISRNILKTSAQRCFAGGLHMKFVNYILEALIVAAVVVPIIYINVVVRKERSEMTPAERKAQDEEVAAESFW
jgi:uncharacterized membrane protein